jgi:hypothetical protein
MSTALSIDSLHAFELTEDGVYLLVNTNQSDRIALHCSVMHELLAALSTAIGRSERIRHKNQGIKFAMPCEAWEVGADITTSAVVFTFRLPGGAELSFQLGHDQAARIGDILALMSRAPTGAGPYAPPLQ